MAHKQFAPLLQTRLPRHVMRLCFPPSYPKINHLQVHQRWSSDLLLSPKPFESHLSSDPPPIYGPSGTTQHLSKAPVRQSSCVTSRLQEPVTYVFSLSTSPRLEMRYQEHFLGPCGKKSMQLHHNMMLMGRRLFRKENPIQTTKMDLPES